MLRIGKRPSRLTMTRRIVRVERITPQDVVLDIGAGDLRLAQRLAAIAQHVYAIERNAGGAAHDPIGGSWPANLIVICADALTWHVSDRM